MGCGATRCEELRGFEDVEENAMFVVCNYGPGYVEPCHPREGRSLTYSSYPHKP